MAGRHNPLRSEEEAFRWVIAIVVGALVVIGLTAATRPLFGAILIGVLVVGGAAFVWRGSEGREPVRTVVAGEPDHRHRILVVANQTVAGGALLDEIRDRAAGKETEILIVTPALTGSQLQHWVSDVDAAMVGASERLQQSLDTLSSAGIEAHGEVGDSEPNQAITDALLKFGADEIIISTLPPGRSRWLEKQVVERAREEVDRPIIHVVVDVEAEAAPSS